jgi:hypothetical protein
MAKVTWSVPLVQFGRCEVEFEGPEALQLYAEPDKFGAQYADFVAGVMKGFEARQQEIREGNKPDRVVEAPPGDPGAARARLAEGKKPRTVDEDNEMARQVIEEGLGLTTEVPNDAPPWEQEPPKKSEPWKTDGPVKKPAKIEW